MCRFLRIFLPLFPVLVFCPRSVRSLLRVSVSPPSPLFPLGSASRLLCEARGCRDGGGVTFTWAPLEDRPLTASVSSNATHSAVTFDPVRREHEGPLLCKASCGGERGQSKSDVQVYALPFAPEVSGPASVLVGVRSSWVCSVRDVYPPDLVSVEWIRGDQVLLRVSGESGSAVVRSQLDFTPQRPGLDQDSSQNSTENSTLDFVCRAWMDLPGLSPDQRSRETAVQVQLHFPPTRVSLSVMPEPVLEGRDLTLSCQSDGAPPPTLVLSRNGAELQHQENTHFLSFNLSAAQLQDSAHYLCESTNQYGAARDQLNLTVRAHPLQVSVLQTVTAADSGSSLVLTCETQGCSEDPVLTWTKTGSDLASDSDGPVLLRTTDRSGSRLALKDLDLQDSGVYSCEAQCDSVIRSGTTQVQVYSFPLDPVLPSPGPVVLGRPAVVLCSVPLVFPAARLRLQWLMGNESVQSEDSFPHSETLLNVSSELRLDQDLQNQLWTMRSPGVSCRAEILTEEGEVWRSRSAAVSLELHHAPLNVSLTVTPEPALEGRDLTLSCQSDGAPPPTLVLSRNGTELQRQDNAHFLSFSLSAAQLQDSAHYLCESTNQYGAARDQLNLTVRAPPRNTSVLVLPSSVVFEGQNVTVCCSSVCVPPPSVYLTKLTNGTQRHSPDGTFLLVNVSAQDSGLYQVNVSNELGFQVHVFSISVRERSSSHVPSLSLSLVLISSLCVAAGLSSAALFLEYIRRARKKGFYQLPQSNPQPT